MWHRLLFTIAFTLRQILAQELIDQPWISETWGEPRSRLLETRRPSRISSCRGGDCRVLGRCRQSIAEGKSGFFATSRSLSNPLLRLLKSLGRVSRIALNLNIRLGSWQKFAGRLYCMKVLEYVRKMYIARMWKEEKSS